MDSRIKSVGSRVASVGRSPSFIGGLRKSFATVLTAGALAAACGIEVKDADFTATPVSLTPADGGSSETGADAQNPTDTIDASAPDVVTTDIVDVVIVDTGTDSGTPVDMVDASIPVDMPITPDVTPITDRGVDVPVDMPPADVGVPCRPTGMHVSGDNINNSYDTQSAVPVVIDTTGDCSATGTSLAFSINYGVAGSVIRPVLAIDSTRNQIRTNLDLTDPSLVGFPDNHRNIRLNTMVAGLPVETSFLRKRYPATFQTAGTVFGSFVGTVEYNARIQLNDTSTPSRPDDFNRDALVGIDLTNDTGSTLLWHGALTTCDFSATTNPCIDEVLDGSGRTQRCFIPNMLTADRTNGFCDVSEGRVFTYPGGGVSYGMQIRGVDFNRVRTATPVGGYIRAAVYITDIAQNVTIGNYRFRRGD